MLPMSLGLSPCAKELRTPSSPPDALSQLLELMQGIIIRSIFRDTDEEHRVRSKFGALPSSNVHTDYTNYTLWKHRCFSMHVSI